MTKKRKLKIEMVDGKLSPHQMQGIREIKKSLNAASRDLETMMEILRKRPTQSRTPEV
jgi:hypothetical protein